MSSGGERIVSGLIVGAGVIVQELLFQELLFQELLFQELLFQELEGGWPNLPWLGAPKELDPPPEIPPCHEQVPDPPFDGLTQPSEHMVPAETLETTGTPAASERTGAYRAESRSDPMTRSRRFLMWRTLSRGGQRWGVSMVLLNPQERSKKPRTAGVKRRGKSESREEFHLPYDPSGQSVKVSGLPAVLRVK